jgi:hypothetical protein
MIEAVYLQYALTMREAQMFETALCAVAAQELDLPPGHASRDEIQARTEMFFSRPIGWVQQRLDMTPALAAEINELREIRNELAHNFLVGFMWTQDLDSEDVENPEDDLMSWLPAHLRSRAARDTEAIAEQYEAEQEAAIVRLREWRDRFKFCNSVLYKRFLAPLRHFDTWEEMEEDLRAEGSVDETVGTPRSDSDT